MVSPRPAGSSGKTTPIRVNPDFLAVLRHRLLEKLAPRLAAHYDEEGNLKFADGNFVRAWGRGLEKLTDTLLIHSALMHLDVDMRGQPIGRCGIPLIDDVTPGNDFDADE